MEAVEIRPASFPEDTASLPAIDTSFLATEMFETKVHLFLFVKVREKWSDDPERYREMGLQWTK